MHNKKREKEKKTLLEILTCISQKEVLEVARSLVYLLSSLYTKMNLVDKSLLNSLDTFCKILITYLNICN